MNVEAPGHDELSRFRQETDLTSSGATRDHHNECRILSGATAASELVFKPTPTTEGARATSVGFCGKIRRSLEEVTRVSYTTPVQSRHGSRVSGRISTAKAVRIYQSRRSWLAARRASCLSIRSRSSSSSSVFSTASTGSVNIYSRYCPPLYPPPVRSFLRTP